MIVPRAIGAARNSAARGCTEPILGQDVDVRVGTREKMIVKAGRRLRKNRRTSGAVGSLALISALGRHRWRWGLAAAAGLATIAVVSRRSRTARSSAEGRTMDEGTVEGGTAEDYTASADLPRRHVGPENLQDATVGGVRMQWEEHGDGVPIVMVHGIPTNPRLWRHVIAALGPGFRCLAWELVGFGWSAEAGFGRDISIAAQAEYLSQWLDHRGIDRAFFVGHDLGGGVVQRLMTREPERVAGVVLADCIAFDNWPVAPLRMARRLRGVIPLLPPSLLKPMFLSGLFELGHDDDERRRDSVRLHWEAYNRAVGPKAFAHQVGCLDNRDTMEIATDLERLRVPARVVWGDADPLGMESGERLARALNAPLVRIPGGRHFSPEDHPEIIASTIDDLVTNAALTTESDVDASPTTSR